MKKHYKTSEAVRERQRLYRQDPEHHFKALMYAAAYRALGHNRDKHLWAVAEWHYNNREHEREYRESRKV